MSRATTASKTSGLGAGAAAAGHVGDVRALGEVGLAALLAVRPDLAHPVPGSIEEVEARALSPDSVYQALLGADTAVLQLAQILALCGTGHVTVADIRRMEGDVPDAEVGRQLDWVVRRHLAVRISDTELCVHPVILAIPGAGGLGPAAAPLVERLTVDNLRAVLTALGRRPTATRKAALTSGLLDFLSDGDAVRTLVASADPEVRQFAARAATQAPHFQLPWHAVSQPYGRPPARAPKVAPGVWLVDHGLAFRNGWTEAVMPLEVGLALRGGHPFPPASYCRPVVAPAPATFPAPAISPEPVEVEARAVAAVAAVERLAEHWGSRPAAVLKTGGVGVREIRRLSGDIEVPERDAFRVVELAASAGLVAVDHRRGLALPTPGADEWLDLATARRWWVLATAWLGARGYPSLAGATDVRDKVLPALAHTDAVGSAAADQRRSLLRLVLETGTAAPAAVRELADLAGWDAPLAWAEGFAPRLIVAEWTLQEMALLGLAVGGSPTPLAVALAGDDVDAVQRLLGGPGTDAWQLVLQADLTALATGRLPARVRAELELMAEVDGRGHATVYRFSESSLRRAFDAGRSEEEISGFLAEHAAKGVPQALGYLVGDVGRRHGHIRVGRAACFVRFDDPVLAVEALHSKKVAKLGLRQIAPTVLVSDRPHGLVVQALRAGGYLPVEEAGDGSVVHTEVARERAAPVRPLGAAPPLAASPRPDDVDHSVLAAKLLRGRRPAGGPDGHRAKAASSGLLQRVELPTLLRQWARAGVLDAGIDPDQAQGAGGGPWEDDDDAEWDEVDWGSWPDELPQSGPDDPLRSEADDDPTGVAGHRSGVVPRPTGIARGADGVAELLRAAATEEWLVRISYVTGSGRSSEVTVDILDLTDTAMLAQVAPKWTEQKYVLARIGWARVLTEAEEELT